MSETAPVTRDVVLDLLPLYLEGAASRDTRALVESYLARDPELAASAAEVGRLAPPAPTATAGADQVAGGSRLELEALRRTRRWLGLRSALLAVAIFVTLLPFSFVGTDGQVAWVWEGRTSALAAIAVVAGLAWSAYGALRWRLRGSAGL
jgi:hypothetical protein